MIDFLKEAQNVLRDLDEELQKRETFCKQIDVGHSEFSSILLENRRKKHNQSWIHGAIDFRESNELERWLFDNPELSDTAKSSALHCVECWRNWMEIKDTYYVDCQGFEFEEPLKEETLIAFIHRMAEVVEREGKSERLEWRAFKSFLSYLRNLSCEEIAFIEQIFPKNMDVSHGKVFRKIQTEVPAIPQELACIILKELARVFRFGRSNVQLTAGECFGLCWLCLTASRLRLPIHLEKLWSINTKALFQENGIPMLLVPTLFGDRKIRISQRMFKFFDALSRIPSLQARETILQRPFRSLTRVFFGILKNIPVSPDYGNISYITFLSPPHHFGDYRYQSK